MTDPVWMPRGGEGVSREGGGRSAGAEGPVLGHTVHTVHQPWGGEGVFLGMPTC